MPRRDNPPELVLHPRPDIPVEVAAREVYTLATAYLAAVALPAGGG